MHSNIFTDSGELNVDILGDYYSTYHIILIVESLVAIEMKDINLNYRFYNIKKIQKLHLTLPYTNILYIL